MEVEPLVSAGGAIFNEAKKTFDTDVAAVKALGKALVSGTRYLFGKRKGSRKTAARKKKRTGKKTIRHRGLRKMRAGKRRFRKKRFRLKKNEQLGPIQVDKLQSGDQITSTINQVSYNDFQIGTAAVLTALVGYFFQVGETDANAERVEEISRQSWPGLGRILVRAMYMNMHFRNNTSYPCDLTLYDCTPRVRTDKTPSTAMIEGLDDRAGSDQGWESEPSFYPSDSVTFKRRYQITNTIRVRLNPGDEFNHVLKRKGSFVYNDDWEDDTSDKDIARYRSRFTLARLQGVICHDDTTETNVGFAQAELDVVTTRITKWQHISSNTIERWRYTDQLDTVTTETIAGPDVTEEEKYGD